MMSKAVRLFWNALAVSGLVIGSLALISAFWFNYQRNQDQEAESRSRAVDRCLDARDSKVRAYRVLELLRDVDDDDGHVSSAFIRYEALVNHDYASLRACDSVGMTSTVRITLDNGRTIIK